MRQALAGGIALAGMVLGASTASSMPRDPSGTYLTEDGRARIRLEKCGPTNENICGFVVWLDKPANENGSPKTDLKNSDRRKTARPLLGHQLIMGLKPGEDRFEGMIYNSEDGRSYEVGVWLAKQDELKVRGCLLAVLCATQTWTRRSDTAPGQLAAATGLPGGPLADPEWAKPAATGSTGAAQPRRPAPAKQ
jgi:uncharacterized protein (DUF2147 family)